MRELAAGRGRREDARSTIGVRVEPHRERGRRGVVGRALGLRLGLGLQRGVPWGEALAADVSIDLGALGGSWLRLRIGGAVKMGR
ncbi:MAG: hypothetical protein KC636_18345 [Myxococcales bacterium]|nr:hypothetical protein [Myxococcales bacterium]